MPASSRVRITPTATAPFSAEVDDAAENLINARPSRRQFSSLAEREAAHAKLFLEAAHANAAGDVVLACAKFAEAYSLLFRTATLVSLVNMKLKLGEAELAAACYAKILRSDVVSAAEVRRVEAKLAEAKQLHAEARAIMEAPQARVLLLRPEERERDHRKLVDKGRRRRPRRAR